MDWRCITLESRMARYGAAMALAIAGQFATITFVEPASLPLIIYAPFVVISAVVAGLGPGLVTTALCALEATYLVIEPTKSFAIADRKDWDRIATLVLTGLIASVLSEGLRRFAGRLSEANRKIGRLLENLSDGFSAFDREWRYTYVNEAGARLVGKTREELLGRNLWELWPEAGDSPFGAALRRALAENVPIQVEAFYAPLNAWFEARCHPSPDGLSLFFSDTTARRHAAEQSRLLSSIVASSDDAIISKDLDGIILSWNRGAEQIYGHSAEEMIGQPISRLLPDDHPNEFPGIMECLRLGQKIEHLETERIRKDGRRISVSVTLSPLRDESGAMVGASSIARDITGAKQAQHAVKRSELRYRSLVRAVSQIIWTTNAQGDVTEDMPAWREFSGQTFEEVKERGWLETLHPDDRDRALHTWLRAVRNRSFYATEYRMRRADGEYRWMSAHGAPLFDEKDEVQEWVGICTDIHDRVAAEEEVRRLNQQLEERVLERTAALQAANQELEAFAYSVSHDLRAPLRAISGFSRILREEFSANCPAEVHRYLGIIADNAVQMGKLIDGLLLFSRLGRQAMNVQPVAPAGLVEQAWADLAAEQQNRQVEMRMGNLPPCRGDPLLLKQVFLNLLSNSLKYTRKRPAALIEVGFFRMADLAGQSEVSNHGALRAASPDTPVYFVRDNGAGFDMRYADKLFGVFQRLHRAEEYEGTGVGLATVRRIITRHGGHVWAEGALEQGATFYFTLDCAAEVPGGAGLTDVAVSGERS